MDISSLFIFERTTHLHADTKKVIQRSSLWSLQFRILKATANVQKMSIKEVDGETVVNHFSHFIDNRHRLGVDEQKEDQERSRLFYDRHVFIQT